MTKADLVAKLKTKAGLSSKAAAERALNGIIGIMFKALSKGDKIKPTELAATTQAVATEIRKRPAAHPEVLPTAAGTGDGIAELRAAELEAVED